MDKSIMISGVGGQGTLLASRIIGRAAISSGFDVKVSEVHGMSQRGGSVVTYVKYSDTKVYSPVISDGSADIILAFERLEAYRSVPALKKGGKLIANEQIINPMPVITQAESYPEAIFDKIRALGIDLITADALSMAERAGSSKAVNVVLIGVLAPLTGIGKDVWLSALKSEAPPKFADINLRAFELGYNLSK